MKDFNVEGVGREGGWTGDGRGGEWESGVGVGVGGENMSQVSLPAPGTVLSPLPALLGTERREKREN